MIQTLFIRGLKMQAIIGIHPHERDNRQPLLLDLDYVVPRVNHDHIDATVCYDTLASSIKQLVESTEYQLIETLADTIRGHLKSEFNLKQFEFTLYKPDALKDANTVGIKIQENL